MAEVVCLTDILILLALDRHSPTLSFHLHLISAFYSQPRIIALLAFSPTLWLRAWLSTLLTFRAVAMPEFVRAWTIPKSATHPEFEIKLREPSIVNDGTGLKTWGTAFVMAKKMEEIGTKCFGGLISTSTNADINIPDTFTTAGGKSFVRPDLRVLEYVTFIVTL